MIPFAWLRAALSRKADLPPAVAERFKAEPIAMEIKVDTTDLKAALALLEQIAAEAKRANDALDIMRSHGAPIVTR